MPADIQYPSRSVEDSLEQNMRGKGFGIGVQFPGYLGLNATTYQSYGDKIPLVKLIEESQFFIDRVSDRHCLDGVIWTKQSGANSRYEYEPVCQSGYKLAGYPLYDHEFWNIFKLGVVDLGSGLHRVGVSNYNTGHREWFNPWTNLASKVQWSGTNYNPLTPYSTIPGSGRPHPESFLHYGKPNIEDFLQYVPIGQQKFLSTHYFGQITEIKSVVLETELNRVQNGISSGLFFSRNSVINNFEQGYPPCSSILTLMPDFGTPSFGTYSFTPKRDVVKYMISGVIDLNGAAQYIFNDDANLPTDVISSGWVCNFLPVGTIGIGGNSVTNTVTHDYYTVMSTPRNFNKSFGYTDCLGHSESRYCVHEEGIETGKPVTSLSLSRQCQVYAYPLLYSGLSQLGGTNNLKNRTGVEYSGGRGLYYMGQAPSLYDEGFYINSHPSGIFATIGSNYLTAPSQESPSNRYIEAQSAECGAFGSLSNNVIFCDRTIKSDHIIQPSGKFIVAYSLENSASGIVETWRNRSYKTLYEFDTATHTVRNITSPYSFIGAPSGNCYTYNKDDSNNAYGYGYEPLRRHLFSEGLMSGVAEPNTSNVPSLEEIMQCGFESDKKYLAFYYFKQDYGPVVSDKWISDVSYSDYAGYDSVTYTGFFVETFPGLGTVNSSGRFTRTDSGPTLGYEIGNDGRMKRFENYQEIPYYPEMTINWYNPLNDDNGYSTFRAIPTNLPGLSGNSIIDGPVLTEIGPPTLLYNKNGASPYYLEPYYDFQ